MVMQLIPLMVGIAVAIIVAIALFSVFPSLVSSFTCPNIQVGVNGTEAGAAWAESCKNLQTQTTIVPVLIALAIVIAAILIVTRMFM
jgi:large-conductance mechanosensitive channel